MARVEPMFPIVSVNGPFGTSLFVTYKWGIDLVQRTPIMRSGIMKRRNKESKPCQGFRRADSIYSNWPEARKQVWRDAVKKPVVSGYTLWMKECLFAWAKGWYAPDVPSISGGYSYRHVSAGTEYPPPED